MIGQDDVKKGLVELRSDAIDKAMPEPKDEVTGEEPKEEKASLDEKLKASPPTSRAELESLLASCGYKLTEDGEM
jgi:hypothetical protein